MSQKNSYNLAKGGWKKKTSPSLIDIEIRISTVILKVAFQKQQAQTDTWEKKSLRVPGGNVA